MYSSEALKKGIKPDNEPEQMTAQERKTFRLSVDPDMMGFDGQEGMLEEDEDAN